MAKRRGAKARAGSDFLAQFGYPSDKELRREAAALAQASLPSPKTVAQPYNRQLQSARDFMAAVQSALAASSGDITKAYDTAQASSQAVGDAASARLAGLGLGDYAAGTQAAQGARSDSAVQNLIAQGASARDYAARQPAIGAGMGALAALGIGQKKTDALSARQDALRQAFQQAISTVSSQHLAMAQFNQGQSQFLQSQALQREGMAQNAALAAQDRRFRANQAALDRSASRQNAHDQILAQYGYDTTTGQFTQGQSSAGVQGIATKYGLTPNQVISLQNHSATQVEGLLKQGKTYAQALSIASAHGVPPEVAKLAVYQVYANATPPPTPAWQGVSGRVKGMISDVAPPTPNTYKAGKQDLQYIADMKKWRTYATNYTRNAINYVKAVNDFQKFMLSPEFKGWLGEITGVPYKAPVLPPHHGR